jgi:hypothetical protein
MKPLEEVEKQEKIDDFYIQLKREIDAFQPFFDDISAISWWIFMQNTASET